MSEPSWRSLVEPCFARLARWEITRPEKLLGGWIVLASFANGRPWVLVDDQRTLARHLAMDEGEVSRALSGLVGHGVLQRSRERLSSGARVLKLRWLPNATLVQPEVESQFAPAASSADTARLAELNGWPLDTEPGGQVRLNVRSIAERLDDELAMESARAVLPDAEFDEARMRAEIARQFGNFPNRDDGSGGESLGISQTAVPALHAGAGAGETSETFADVQTHTFQTSVQTGAIAPGTHELRALRALGDPQVQYALELVRKAAGAKAEDRVAFAQWERKWKTRCRAEPALIAEFAADELDAQRGGRGAKSATKWIFSMAKRAAEQVGRSLKCLFF